MPVLVFSFLVFFSGGEGAAACIFSEGESQWRRPRGAY
jgi:hypothetical protein